MKNIAFQSSSLICISREEKAMRSEVTSSKLSLLYMSRRVNFIGKIAVNNSIVPLIKEKRAHLIVA